MHPTSSPQARESAPGKRSRGANISNNLMRWGRTDPLQRSQRKVGCTMCRHRATLLLCASLLPCLSTSLAAQIDVTTGNISSDWQIPNSTTFQGESGTSDKIVQAGPSQTFTTNGSTSAGITFQAAPIGSGTTAGTTVNPTIVRGALNSAPGSAGAQKAGDLYVGPAATMGRSARAETSCPAMTIPTALTAGDPPATPQGTSSA